MKKGNKYQTKHRMFVSYICIPVVILTVISCLFSYIYYRMSRERVLDFENSITENVDNELKNLMDNLIKSSVQYSMTPWVTRLKYLQKTPQLMDQNITASDISDYASMLSLTEINDNMVESIYIYYSLGGFGISSIGKVSWKEYASIYQVQCRDTAFLSGSMLDRNNQKTICHNASLMKNGKRVTGFFMLQTIPLQNSYSGEMNILFFVPYEKICAYIENFMSDATADFYLTDGQKVIYTWGSGEGPLFPGDTVEARRMQDKSYRYSKEFHAYLAQYTKSGMEIGIVQILDNAYLNRDFSVFADWLVMGYLVLLALIVMVAARMAKYSYQPLEHIMKMLVEEEPEESINEYQIIEKALEELDSQKKRLEVTVFEQNPLIEQYILHTLLRSNKPQANEVKYVNTMRQYSRYRCLALRHSPEAGQYIREIDSCLAIYPQIHSAYVEEDNYYIWILSYGEESLMEEITDFLSQTFEDSGYKEAALGMSKAHEDILHILSAFNQAARALEYHFFYPDKKIIRLEEDRIEERDLNCASFEIPGDKIKSMREAAGTLDAGGLFESYQAVLLYNFQTLFLHKEAYFAGIHKLNSLLLELIEKESQGSLTPQMELLEPENFAGLNSYLQTFRLKTVRLMEQCAAKENPVYYARNQRICRYVEAHLTDASLSLNETARVMHYTATYFGKYFKEQFGCTFQKYVAARRMECAISLLEKKDMNVQEIALKCGFTNDVTFRRTFKMYVGVTPSQYEKEKEV